MRRRSRAAGEPVKTRRRKTAARKRGYAPKAVRPQSFSALGQENIVARLTRERNEAFGQLSEALEQQTATSEVLRVISGSPGELQPVFDAMLQNATRICEAKFGTLYLREGEGFRTVAVHNAPPAYIEARIRELIRPPPDGALGRVAATKRVVHIADIKTIPSYVERNPVIVTTVELGGYRTVLAVPMLKNNELIGVITINRQEVRPFTDRQIALVQNFADQAVIAIENTRLLNELRQRTTDLSVSLEQQTATSDVLKIISTSSGNLQPVFDAILQDAVRICDAKFGNVYLWDRDALNLVATHNTPSALVEARRRSPFRPGLKSPLRRLVTTKSMVHVMDAAVEQAYVERDPRVVAAVELGGIRTFLAVPMLKEGELIGVLTIYRQEVRPFTDKQINLVKNFAAQAVIAIENARLLNELRQRTTDLTESLEQQTATSQVLSVISSSPAELEPVFKAILANATQLCGAKFGILNLYDGEVVRSVAFYNVPPEYADMRLRERWWRPHPRSGIAEVVRTKQPVQIDDIRTSPAYLEGDSTVRAFVNMGGARTIILVPMLKDDKLIGIVGIYRQEVRPFTDKQIGLVQNFAAQAVIAIENTRLLNELRQRTTDLTEALEQQTATSEVLKVISASPGELEPVFDAVLENATRLCEAKFATLWLCDGNLFHAASLYNAPPAYAENRKRGSILPGPRTALGRVAQTKQAVQIADITTEQAYLEGDPLFVTAVQLGGYRGILSVPMIKDNELIGAIGIHRQEVRPFTEKQIELVQNFAKQAVIAIENTRLLNELRQSLEQQTATADVLRVISSSAGELEPVFQAMLENAVRICDATFGNIYRWDGNALHLVAAHNTPPALTEARRRSPLTAKEPVIARMLETKTTIHIDAATHQGYVDRSDPGAVTAVELGGVRTVLAVPMLKENELIGSFTVYRQEPRPFTEKQISLVTNFAAQAVIAIENTRLLNELRQRTTDLAESLEQQTATSEVLKVISSSPGDLKPVFDAILENATRICQAGFGTLYLAEGNVYRAAATYNVPPAFAEARQREPTVSITGNSALARVVKTKSAVQIVDVAVDPAYRDDPQRQQFVTLTGARTLICVPMLKEDTLIGVIAVYRLDVQSFTDKQIELVKNFAAQAVIAIENTRLLNELRESLQQQTATSEVLSVISSSPTNIQPVLDIIGERAEKLCEAETSVVSIVEGELIRRASIHGVTKAGVEAVRRVYPMRLTDETVTARAIRTRSVCHVADVLSDPLHPKDAARISGFRGSLAVPMIRDEQVVGAIFVARRQPGLFSDAQVQLLKTFADQAVIAIENVRLFNETKNSLEQQTATADVLKIISRSTFDLQTVLQTLVESAARFCNADKANIIREKDGGFYTAEAYGYSREFMDYIKNIPAKAERGSASGRALVEGQVVHIADVKADPEYTLVEAPRLGDFRTILCVPMLREGVPIGVLVLTRSEVQPFTDKQIELVTTFADQAAIAIENVRLFDEIQDKSRQLTEASQHKSQFLANMSHELRTPLNAILGYTELMADGAYGEPSEKMLGILKRLESNGKHLLGLINDVLDLSKIEAGQLVLELSDYSVQDIAQTVRSTLEPLAVDKKLAFKVELATELPPGRGDGRRLTQVLINLVGNAIKFTDAGEVAIKAEANNGAFHISVRDTGPGISGADQARLFQEFQQADNAITRKKGGTGLGLAISKRIIEMHGGRIWVESQPGYGSTFTFTLPVIVERQVEAA
jgi:GAF domain-containing protein/anti-sigma regulatory factor (Ser/Thr protein kinase)